MTFVPWDEDACELVAETSTITRDEWLELRRSGIGGSDAAPAMGLSPFTSPLALYYDKLDPLPDVDKEIFKWGRRLESPIAAAFGEEHGLAVVEIPVMLRSKRWSFMLANPDRWVERDGQWAVLEIKNVHANRLKEWEDGPPIHYRLQGQHYLAVTGLNALYFAVLLGGQKMISFEVDRDEALIEAMVAKQEAFWTLVEMKRPPEPDGSESTSSALRGHYAAETPTKTVEGGDELRQLIARRAAAKSVLEMAEREEREVANRIIALLGDAEAATIDGDVAVTWKSQTRREHVVKESTSRVLRVKGNTNDNPA